MTTKTNTTKRAKNATDMLVVFDNCITWSYKCPQKLAILELGSITDTLAKDIYNIKDKRIRIIFVQINLRGGHTERINTLFTLSFQDMMTFEETSAQLTNMNKKLFEIILLAVFIKVAKLKKWPHNQQEARLLTRHRIKFKELLPNIKHQRKVLKEAFVMPDTD